MATLVHITFIDLGLDILIAAMDILMAVKDILIIVKGIGLKQVITITAKMVDFLQVWDSSFLVFRQ
jgi:hypothetical protein